MLSHHLSNAKNARRSFARDGGPLTRECCLATCRRGRVSDLVVRPGYRHVNNGSKGGQRGRLRRLTARCLD